MMSVNICCIVADYEEIFIYIVVCHHVIDQCVIW